MKQGLLRTKKLGFILLLSGLFFGFQAMAQNSNVTISTSATTGGSFGAVVANTVTFTPTANDANIQASALVTQLQAGNNVVIVTARAGGSQPGNVIFATPVTALPTGTTQRTFTVTAGGSITVNSACALNLTPAAVTNSTGRPSSNIVFTAGTGGSVKLLANVIATGGNGSGNNQSGGAAGDITLTGPAGITITGNITANGGLKTSGAGSGGNGADGDFIFNDGATTVTTGGGANDGQTAGIIDGGALTKSGTGTFYMAGSNIYAGTTAVTAGTLELGADGALGATTAGTTITSGAVLDLNGIAYATTEALAIAGTGISSGGALINTSPSDATYAGLLSLTNTSSIVSTIGAITLSNTGTISGATFSLTLGGAGDGSIASIIGTTSGTLTKTGAGTWNLSGANTYTGSTTVTAGILRASSTVVASTAGAFGNSGGAVILNGGAIESNTATFSRALSVTAAGSRIDAYGAARTISSAISATGAYALTVGGTTATSAEGQDLTLSGVLSNGTGTLSLIKNLTSTVIISGTNTYTGTTTITAGTLRPGNSVVASTNGAFGNSAGAVVLNGGTLEFNNATFSRSLSVTGNGSRIDAYGAARTISAPISATGAYSLTIGGTTVASSSGQDLILSGAITNGTTTLAIVKDLSSNLTLSSTSNTYTGGTTISAGVLTLGAAGVLADAGAVILDGGTLRTGATTGFTETIGTLRLTDNSNLTLGTGNHTLTFNTATSGQSWTGGTQLTINNWVGGYNGTTAGTSNPKIFVGANNTGLTSGQLAQTKFYNGTSYIPAIILGTGEVVPSTTPPSALSYTSPNTFTAGTAISSLSPTVTGVVVSYSVSPALPTGLSLNTTTGVISGTPTLAGAGTYTVTATNVGGSTTFDVVITVNPGALNNFLVEQAAGGNIATQVAGAPFNIKITARDIYNNTVTGFNSTVALTENTANGSISPTTSSAFVNGVLASQAVTLTQATATIITATSGSTGSSNSFTVSAGALNKLQVLLPGETAAPGSATGKTGTPTAQTAGTSFTTTVNGVDANWNIVSSTNTVTLTASNGNTMPGAAALSAGVRTFTTTLTTAGTPTITATATGPSAGVSAAVTVNAGALNNFLVETTGGGNIPTQTAGTPFNIQITARDASGNTVTSFNGTVALTENTANGTISPTTSSAFVNGVLASQSVTVTQATSQAITATSGSAGTSNTFAVNAGALAKLQLLMPGETAAPGSATGKTGTATTPQNSATVLSVIVNGVDANWNVVTSAIDNISITTTDAYATLTPASGALVSGTRTFSVTLVTAGVQTVTATDATNGAITAATSPGITINAVTRTSAASTAWNLGSTWVGGIVPATTDPVIIRSTHTVVVTADATCASVTMGDATTAAGISVNTGATLNVVGALAVSSSTSANRAATLAGAGALTAASLSIGNSVTPGANVTTTLTSTIADLNVSGNVAIVSSGTTTRNNSTFTITSGNVSVDGIIQPTTGANAGCIASLVLGNSSPTLELTTAVTPFGATGNSGLFTTTLNGTGATVIYGRNGAQTAHPTTYTNLVVTGSGVTTTTGVTVNGILSVEGTATLSAVPTYGSAATLQYNTTTARTAGVEWPATFAGTGGVKIANTGAITLNAAKIISAGPLTINPGATLSTSGSNYALTLAGNLTINGTFTAGSSNVTVNGSGAQSIDGFSTTGSFTRSGTGTATLNDNITVNTFAQSAGTLDDGGNTITVTGTGASTWAKSGGTFTATGTVNFTGSAPQISATNFNNLQISVGSTATITGAVNLNNTTNALTFTSGTLITGANTLTLASGSSVLGAGAGKHVVGNVAYTFGTGAATRTFPIGDGTNYAPLTIAFANVTTGGTLSATVTGADNAGIGNSGINALKSVNHSWSTAVSGGLVFTTATATFGWAGVGTDADAGSATASYKVAKLDAGVWTLPATANPSATSIQATSITNLTASTFQVGEIYVSLPGDYYRSKNTTGNWNTAASWQSSPDNINWSNSTLVPDNNAAGILIQAGHTITVTASTTASDLTIAATGILTVNNGITLSMYGDWTNSGTLSAVAGSTVTFTGAAAQVMSGTATTGFTNLVINKTAAANTVTSTKSFTVATALTVTQGNLILQATDADYGSNDVTVSTNGTLTHSVNWDVDGKQFVISGNLSVDGLFTYTVRSHVQMNGVNKTVKTGNTAGSALSILTLKNTSGSISANGKLIVNDNFWAAFGVVGGTFNTNGQSVTANSGLLGDGGRITVGGAGTSLNVIGGIQIGYTSLADTLNVYAGTVTADFITVGNGTRTGALNFTGGTIDVGNVTITSAGIFTITGSPTMTVSGDWTRNGGTFNPGTSNIIFDGAGAQTIAGTSTTQTFNNIEVNKTASTLTVATSANSTINAVDLTITAGTFAAGNATNINVSGDWTNAGAFTNNSQLVTFNGSSAQVIAGPTVTTFYNVTLNNSTGLSLGVNTTIANVLTLTSGKVTTGANTLFMSALSTTSITGYTATAPGRFIIGNLRSAIPNAASVVQIFPLGEGSTYLPVTLTFTGTTSGSGSITVSTTASNDANIATSTINETKNVERYWTVTNTGVAGFTSYSPTFTFAAADLIGSPTTSSFIVGRYNGGWTYPALGARNSTNTTATGLGTTAFGNFIIGEGGAAVPVMTTQPVSIGACIAASTSFTAAATTVPGATVQWQINTGSGFGNLTIASPYSVNTSGTSTTSSTLTINPTSAGLTGYQYRAVFTNTKGSVTSNAATLTINPYPSLFNVGGTTAVCPNGSANITLSGSTSGVSYQLRNNANDAAVGSPVAGTGSGINLPTGSISGTTTYNVLATVVATGCNIEMNSTATVTVNAIPVATATNSSQTICSGEDFTTIALGTSNNVTGTTFAWTRNNTASVTGIAASGSGSITGVTLTNTTSSPVTVTFTITPTGPASTLCAGSSITATIVVNPLPTVNVTPATSSVCLGGNVVLTGANSGGASGGTVSGSNNTTVSDNGNDPQSVSTSITLPSGTLTSLSNITLTFKASHTFAGDVIATLTSPCGTSTIFSRPGGTGNGDDLISTGNYVFTTASATTFPGSSGGSVPNGTYRATFSGINIAPTCSNVAGTWTLTLSTPSTGGNDRVITLNSWSISISNSNAYTTAVTGPATISSVTYSGSGNTSAAVTVTPPVGTNTYTFTTTDYLGCSNSSSASVTVNPLPAATISTTETSGGTNNDGTICASAAVQLTANPTSGMNYTWSANAATGNSSTANITPATTTAYTVTVSNSTTNCSATATSTITVPMPTATITAAETSGITPNDDNICLNGSATLTAVPSTAGYTYSWASPITPASGNGKVVSPTITATYNVTVTHTATGCTLPAAKTITVNALPAVAITSDYCVGNGNVSLTSNVFSSYVWSTAATTRAITVDEAGTYFVTATNAAGCTAEAFTTVAIELVTNGNFNSGATGFTTGYANNQANNGLQPEGLYAVGTNANTHHTAFWGKDHTTGTGNFMIINGQSNGSTPIVWQQTVNIVPNTVYYFSAWCMSVNTVGNYAQLQFNVNGSSVGVVASLGAGPSNSTQANANTYWQRFYGTWNSGSATSAVISIVDLQTAAGGNDFAIDDVSCSTLSTVSLGSTVANNTTPMCVGNDITLDANRVGGMSPFTYQWSGPNSYNSTDENPVIANATTGMSGTYRVTITDAHLCSISSSATVTVNARPSVTFTTVPTDPICSRTNAVYATQSGQSSYVWSVPGVLNTDYSIQSGGIGGTNSSVTLHWLTAGSKTVTVNYNNAAGCNAVASISNTTNVNLRPVATFTTVPATPLCSSTNATYTTQAGQSSYVWAIPGTLNTDYTIVSGGTSVDNTLVLQWLTTGSKTVTVNYNNSFGCNSFASASHTITVVLTPVAAATNSSQSICSGTSSVAMSLSTSNSVASTTYAWSRNNTTEVTGMANSGTGNIPAATLVNNTNAPVTVTFTVIPTGPSPTFCVGNPLTTTIIVRPRPVGSATAQSICNGATTNVVLNSTVSGSSYIWSASLFSGNISGASSCVSACGTTIAHTLTTTSTGVVRYTVAPTANSCTGSTFTVDVTVNRPPVITTDPVGGTICLGSPINLSVVATGPTLTYQWRKDGSNIGSNSASYTVANATSSNAGTYDVVVSNACSTVTSTGAVINTTTPYTSSYFENFESSTAANDLPNCITTTNLGSKTFIRTYGGIGAHSGTNFGSWGNNADDWFFTPAISLPAGVPYEFTYWYWSDNTSVQTSMGAAVGTAPTVAAMTTPVGTTLTGTGLGTAQVYRQYVGVFTPPTSGIYYFGAHTTTNPGAAADKVVIDDIGLWPTCSGTPTAGTATSTAPSCVNNGTGATLSVHGYSANVAGIRFQWQSSVAGQNVWSDISGATDSIYTTVINASTDFRCKVSCIYSGLSSVTNVAQVNVYPAIYSVTGGACIPALVGLNGSQTGVNYQLVLNSTVNKGSPVPGTGAALNFGAQIDSGSYSVIATNTTSGCVSQMTGVATVNFCLSTWIGVTDTNWAMPTNWDPAAIPNNCFVNVRIPAGTPFSPGIHEYDINVRNIDVASGVTLSLQNRNLNVCGNWKGGTASNALVVGDGTVYINTSTSATQTISGNTRFDVLQIVNNHGVTFVDSAKVSIKRGLHLQTGNLNVTNGTLRLLSLTASSNSYIDDFSAGYAGTITGEVIVDRYVPVPGRNQHFLSSPVSTPSLTQINASGPDGAYVLPTGNCDENYSGLHTPYGSVFVYNDGYRPPNYCMLGNWMVKSVGNMDNARGYSVYLTGNTTLSLTGAANTGNMQVGNLNNSGYPTVYTLQNQPIESGWNLVGNPYPSAIDLTVDRTTEGFQNQVQLWKTTGPFAGSWQADIIDGDAGHAVVPPFQAYMVRTMESSLGMHNYKFYQSERTRNTALPFYRAKTVSTLQLELDYNGARDVTKIAFNSSATNGFDDAYDANKYNGSAGRPTLYTYMTGNTWYAINTLPLIAQATTVPMGLRPEVTGAMTLSPVGIQSFDPTTYIFLEDKKTGNWHNLRNGAYTFSTVKTDVATRFVVHFTPPASILTTDASCEGPGFINIEQPGSASWNYTLTDNANTTVASGSLNQDNPVSLTANTGVYTLVLVDNNGYTVTKSIIVGGSQSVVSAFTTTVNTAQAGETVGFTSTTDAATYSWNFGDGSGSTDKTATHTYANEGVYLASLTTTNAEGCSSISTQSITITAKAVSTGIGNITNQGNIPIWSNDNRVYVDFSKEAKVEAEIEIYNVLGQLISSEKFGKSSVYSREVVNTEAAYMIVKVMNDDHISMKKVFIANGK